MRLLVTLIVAVLSTTPGVPGADPHFLEEGLEAWARRAEGSSGEIARDDSISTAVRAFEKALQVEPDDLAARAWLLKALWFQGEHTDLGEEEKLAIFERARDIAQQGVDELAARFGTDARSLPPRVITRLREEEDAAEVYFWCAAHWCLWGRHRGKIAAARQGVAAKIRDYAEITIALDPLVEGAGGHRILGRLHTEAPRLPIVTGWIDRDQAIQHLERAHELAPSDWLNELYLLEAVIEFDSERRDWAIARLRAMAAREPRNDTRVEDHKMLADARDLLRRVGG